MQRSRDVVGLIGPAFGHGVAELAGAGACRVHGPVGDEDPRRAIARVIGAYFAAG